MKVSQRKIDFDINKVINDLNLKLLTEMFGEFSVADGVFPAYHMNKLRWIEKKDLMFIAYIMKTVNTPVLLSKERLSY